MQESPDERMEARVLSGAECSYLTEEENKVAPIVNHARKKEGAYSDWMKVHVCPRNKTKLAVSRVVCRLSLLEIG